MSGPMKASNPTGMDVFGIASSAKKHLDDDAINGISGFVMSKMNDDGGFRGRSSSSDLYYTFFALATLAGIGVSKTNMNLPELVAPVNSYIRKLDDRQLGFVDLYCMACTLPLLTYLGLPDKGKAIALMFARKNSMFAGRAVAAPPCLWRDLTPINPVLRSGSSSSFQLAHPRKHALLPPSPPRFPA